MAADPNARETPQPGQGGVPTQPPRQGDIDGPKRPSVDQPTPQEQSRRAEERRRKDDGTEPPHWDDHGRLTRHGMEAAIRRGGSVMLPGDRPGRTRIVKEIDLLPTEADLARGDAVAAERVRQGLDDQIAKLVAEKQKLDAPKAAGGGDRPDDEAERLRRENEELRRQLEGRDQGQKQPDQKQPEPPKSDKGPPSQGKK